ncbi:MAG: hypothetical protein COA69_01150 [Robiginitomaculum sp.]|nr:MAG: hypothetical protein COA69_01150 [Robiginitomaculum sp.]
MTDTATAPKILPLKKFMIIEMIASAIINGGFGMLFGWLVARNMENVPFTGPGGIIIDVLVTGFVIGVLLTLIATPLLRGRIGKGVVPDYPKETLPFPLRILPQNVILRALMMGVIGIVVIGPLILMVFWVLKITQLSLALFIWVKGFYGGVFGVVFTPLAMLPMMAGKIK